MGLYFIVEDTAGQILCIIIYVFLCVLSSFSDIKSYNAIDLFFLVYYLVISFILFIFADK